MKALAPIALAVAMLCGHDADAQRDPTQPPPEYAPHSPRAAAPGASLRPESVLTVDGRKYLVVRGRRYAVGDTVQGARIERIDETEVWLRTPEGLRKLPMFPGVEKKESTK